MQRLGLLATRRLDNIMSGVLTLRYSTRALVQMVAESLVSFHTTLVNIQLICQLITRLHPCSLPWWIQQTCQSILDSPTGHWNSFSPIPSIPSLILHCIKHAMANCGIECKLQTSTGHYNSLYWTITLSILATWIETQQQGSCRPQHTSSPPPLHWLG